MPKPNDRISEYILETAIGAGGFGEVWRARHHVWTDQSVAIKIPHDPQYIRNLQREGAAVQGLSHPNIVRALGFDPYASPPYLTMEYVPGTSLRTLIAKKALSPTDAVAVLRQILAGLSYAHAAGVVHRDLKPENVLIHQDAFKLGFDSPGTVRVTDFGLGLSGAGSAAGSIVYSASLNDEAGREIAGSLDYMSPEQRSGATVDARTDLYACGVVLYEMLTGEKPAGTDLPSDLNSSSPKWLDDVFKRSYARLEKRFASADEFLKALETTKGLAVQPPPLPQVRGSARPVPTLGPTASGSPTENVCPTCDGKGIEPGAEWDFCDHCFGRGKLRATSTDGRTELEVECGHCRGRGTRPPAKCTTCKGKGKIMSLVATRAGASTCPRCRAGVDAGDQFCIHCGMQLVTNVRRCPACGAYPDATDRFCILCGQGLGAELSKA